MFRSLSHASSPHCRPAAVSPSSQVASPPPLPHPPFPPPLCRVSTGIAVDKNGLIYFVDGTTIRKVDQNGIISTFLGSNDLTSARPLTCDNSMDINQVIYTAGGQGRTGRSGESEGRRRWLTLGWRALMERMAGPPALCPRSHLNPTTHP